MFRWGEQSDALLALHGFTGCGMDFEALVPFLPAGMAPDLPGHQQTPPATMAEVVDVLAPLAEGRVVVGYSMGGRTALQVACAAEIRALVLVGATPGIAEEEARRERQAQDHALAAHIESIGLRAFLAEWSDKPIIATQKRIPQPWRERMAARKRQHTAEGLAGSLRGMGTGSMPPVWERLPQVPTLLVIGEEDAKFTRIAEAMAERIRGAQIARIPGAGHCAHLESPETVGRLISDFLCAIGSTR